MFINRAEKLRLKTLVKKAEILDILKEINNKESLQRFCRYMEALVAYFKFYGGKRLMAFAKIQVKGQIRLETGLHIGTSNALRQLGY